MINIESKKAQLEEYFRKQKNILAVWIIGSYGTEYQREDSDMDIALLFDKKVSLMEEMQISADLSSILKFENIDTIDLKKAPVTLQFKTIKEGRVLYEAQANKVSDYIEEVLNRYRDEKYYYAMFIKDYKDSFKKGE